MALIDIKWKPTASELRVFAVLWLAFFGLLALWMFYRGSSPFWAGSIAAVAISGGILGTKWPELLRPVYLLWMTLAFPIGWIISHLILGLVYFGILTPIGLLLRLVGHDPLRLKLERNDSSYWCERPTDTQTSRYFRQF